MLNREVICLWGHVYYHITQYHITNSSSTFSIVDYSTLICYCMNVYHYIVNSWVSIKTRYLPSKLVVLGKGGDRKAVFCIVQAGGVILFNCYGRVDICHCLLELDDSYCECDISLALPSLHGVTQSPGMHVQTDVSAQTPSEIAYSNNCVSP